MMGVECKLVVKLDESAMNTIIEPVSIMKPLGWLSKTYIHVKFYNPALQVSSFYSLPISFTCERIHTYIQNTFTRTNSKCVFKQKKEQFSSSSKLSQKIKIY